MSAVDTRHRQGDDRRDAARAIKFMAIKIGILGILPVVVAAGIVIWRLG